MKSVSGRASASLAPATRRRLSHDLLVNRYCLGYSFGTVGVRNAGRRRTCEREVVCELVEPSDDRADVLVAAERAYLVLHSVQRYVRLARRRRR